MFAQERVLPQNFIMTLDATDRRLLAALQEDGRMTSADLAETAGLSPSACHRRVKRLEDEGYIAGYAARVDRRRAGLTIHAYVVVKMDMHHEDTVAAVLKAVQGFEAIVACHAVAGAGDFLLEVVAEDMDAYADVALKRLVRLPGVKDIASTFVLSTEKTNRGWPVG